MKLLFGSLFSGIGGLDLGLERAGMVPAWQVEIDAKCQSVLAAHWPDAKRHDDIRECRGNNLEPVDLICGGFPCQDVSVAGRRAGLAGERSGLWYEFHRVLRELGPRWVVIENVPGLLSSQRGRDFAIILQALAELRYSVCWRVLDAQYFGVPQRRRRVFIVGHLGDGRAAQILFEREGSAWDSPPSREEGQGTAGTFGGCSGGGGFRNDLDTAGAYVTAFCGMAQSGAGWAPPSCPTSDNVSLPLDTRRAQAIAFEPRYYNRDNKTGGAPQETANITNAHKAGDSAPHVLAFEPRYARNGRGAPNSVTSPLKAESGRSGKGDGATMICFDWQQSADSQEECSHTLSRTRTPPACASFGVRRLTPLECERLQGFPDGWTEGQSDSARYRQLGNAVCVPVAEWIGRRIMEAAQ